MSDIVKIIADQQFIELLRKRAALKNQNGIIFYEPHRKQDLFHRAGCYRFRYVRAGNRWGKSDAGAAEDVSWALGYRPFYPVGDQGRTAGIPRRPTKGIVVASDWDKANEIFTSFEDGKGKGKMFSFLPSDRIESTRKNHSGAIDKIVVRGEYGLSTIHFDTVRSFNQNMMSQESSNWDWAHFDEPPPEAMWKGIARGLIDSSGSAWFLCTPLEHPWVNDFFLPSRRQEVDEWEPLVQGNRWMMVGTIYDNPYLPRDAIDEYEKALTPDEKACRLYGIPMASSGMVYKEFRPEVHVYRGCPKGWKDPVDPPADYTIRFAIDPHPRTPHAVLFAATSPFGQTFFFREIFEKVMIKDLCEQIKEVLRGRFAMGGLCDPLAYIENPIDEQTMANEMLDCGVIVDKAPKDPARGILATAHLLKEPGVLYFSEHLQETLWEFDHYVWDPKRPNKPVDKDDHMMENLYRLVITGLDYVSPDDDVLPVSMTRFENPLEMAPSLKVGSFEPPKKKDRYPAYRLTAKPS